MWMTASVSNNKEKYDIDRPNAWNEEQILLKEAEHKRIENGESAKEPT